MSVETLIMNPDFRHVSLAPRHWFAKQIPMKDECEHIFQIARIGRDQIKESGPLTLVEIVEIL